MKDRFAVVLAMLVGVALGAAGIHGLHAQAKPPIYQVTEIDVSNLDAYLKEYAPKAQAAIKKAGGRFVAAGGKVTAIEGTAPASRVAVIMWDSTDQIQAYRSSAEFKDLRKIGDKYAKFRGFAVEGLPQ